MTVICSVFVTVMVLPPSPDLKMTLSLLSTRVKFFWFLLIVNVSSPLLALSVTVDRQR